MVLTEGSTLLRFFHREIANRISIDHSQMIKLKQKALDAEFEPQLKPLEDQLKRIGDELKTKEQEKIRLRNEFLAEMYGTGGSRQRGYSDIAQKVEAESDRAATDFDNAVKSATPRRNELQGAADKLRSGMTEKLKKFEEALGNGFLDRLAALSELTKENGSMKSADYAIILLLVLIEVIPILVKTLSPYGPYDAKLNLKNEADIKDAEFRKNAVVQISEYHYSAATDTELEIERVFQAESLRVRRDEVPRQWERWRTATASGDGALSAEAFVEYAKNDFLLNRTP